MAREGLSNKMFRKRREKEEQQEQAAKQAEAQRQAEEKARQVAAEEEAKRQAAEVEAQRKEAEAQRRIYVVQPGDSLSVIAQKQLGSAGRWPELYELNKATVGDNPNLIHPGQKLVLPD